MIKLFKKLKTIDYFIIILCLLLICGQIYLDLLLPELMSDITAGLTGGSSISQILADGGVMLASALGSALLSIIVGFFIARIAASLSMTLRSDINYKVINMSKANVSRFSTASLITRTTNDVTQIQTFIAMGLQLTIKSPIMAVWAITKIVSVNWNLTIVVMVAIVCLLAGILSIIIPTISRFKKIQSLTDDLNRVGRENLTGTRVVRAFGAEQYQNDKFAVANDNMTRTQTYTTKSMGLLQPYIMLIMNGITLAIYWVGAYSMNAMSIATEKILMFSNIMSFSMYAMQVIASFMMMVLVITLLPRAMVSAGRINEILDTEIDIVDGTSSPKNKRKKGNIEYRNVSFRYPKAENNILDNIDFSVKSGETLAIIGGTGSGKSTLIELLPRLHDVSDGSVIIDDIDVRDYTLKELRKKIGFVTQKAQLFSGSIVSNINLGLDDSDIIADDDIDTSLSHAQAADFVSIMDNGKHSHIDQGGKNVSGGQKQRLSIARAIARKPDILVFDDSFSALDYRTDKNLRNTLNNELKGITCIIVAQRIGTIKNADKIIVLEEGKIVGMGQHSSLLKDCSVYREIALSQLSQEEIDGTK